MSGPLNVGQAFPSAVVSAQSAPPAEPSTGTLQKPAVTKKIFIEPAETQEQFEKRQAELRALEAASPNYAASPSVAHPAPNLPPNNPHNSSNPPAAAVASPPPASAPTTSVAAPIPPLGSSVPSSSNHKSDVRVVDVVPLDRNAVPATMVNAFHPSSTYTFDSQPPPPLPQRPPNQQLETTSNEWSFKAWIKEKTDTISTIAKVTLLIGCIIGALVYACLCHPGTMAPFTDFLKAYWIPTVGLISLTAVALAALHVTKNPKNFSTALKGALVAVVWLGFVVVMMGLPRSSSEPFCGYFVDFWKNHYLTVIKSTVIGVIGTGLIKLINEIDDKKMRVGIFLFLGAITVYTGIFAYNQEMTQLISGCPAGFALGGALGIAAVALGTGALSAYRANKKEKKTRLPHDPTQGAQTKFDADTAAAIKASRPSAPQQERGAASSNTSTTGTKRNLLGGPLGQPLPEKRDVLVSGDDKSSDDNSRVDKSTDDKSALVARKGPIVTVVDESVDPALAAGIAASLKDTGPKPPAPKPASTKADPVKRNPDSKV